MCVEVLFGDLHRVDAFITDKRTALPNQPEGISTVRVALPGDNKEL